VSYADVRGNIFDHGVNIRDFESHLDSVTAVVVPAVVYLNLP
jgi:hypothetical protein